MRTVTLEFLRHGHPHGYLLSPLARYMALCGSHEPADVSVPFDHAELLTRMRGLLYNGDGQSREMQLAEMARLMSGVFAAVPGLVAELAESGGPGEPGPTHLRIIFNANELALLPFELANSASAFPGAGQSMALQSHVPLCITREVRRAFCASVEWPKSPRVLFAHSSAGGEVPVVEHRLALERAIEPWVFHYQEGDEAERQQTMEEHLKILPDATAESLLEACASGSYTHVHLLAHGMHVERDDGRRYALALHPGPGGTGRDLVDGRTLATLLRPQVKGCIEKLACPAVVTLAACDSGNIGSVIGAGASIAHALHEADIPLVVASQFALSFPGSRVMTQVLYEGLLAGADPRLLLIDVRRQLKVRVRDTHDWASVVAYASFPQDLDRQLLKVRVARASLSIAAALNHADRATRAMSEMLSRTPAASGRKADDPSSPESARLLETSKNKLRAAMDRMQAVLQSPFADKSQVHGYLASAHKRKADVFWRPKVRDPDSLNEALKALEQSCAHYRKAFEADRSQSWALVQALVLTAALGRVKSWKTDEIQLARLLSLEDQNVESRQRRAWAHGNMLELRLMHLIAPDVPLDELPAWEQSIGSLLRAVGPEAAEVHSTRQQLSRWVELFPPVCIEAMRRIQHKQEVQWEPAQELAQRMFELLPEPSPFA